MVGQLSNTSYIFLLKTEFSPKVKKKKKESLSISLYTVAFLINMAKTHFPVLGCLFINVSFGQDGFYAS